MSAAPAPHRLRGSCTGAGAGALTIAAHGLGGGAYPDSTALAVVLVVAAAVGACAASMRTAGPIAVAGLLGIGQLAGHVTLSGLTAHQHTPAPLGPQVMVGAHCVATLLCGALIIAAERLHAFLEAIARLVTVPAIRPGSAWQARTFAVLELPIGSTTRSPISRRGPPVPTA